MDPGSVPNRDEQHGGMEAVGEISQTLKHRMRGTLNWERLSRGEREALDMIAHKIARILSGADPHDPEHWRDLAGYAIAARRADLPPRPNDAIACSAFFRASNDNA